MKYLLHQALFAGIWLMDLPFFLLSRLIGIPYQVVHPAATYAPWQKDVLFLRAYRKLKKNSLVNRYQAWELWTLVNNSLYVPGDILEVGVWRGSTSILMGLKLQQLGSVKTLYACDTFEGVVKAGPSNGDNYYKGGEHKDTSLSIVQTLIGEFGLKNIKLLKGIFPEDTGSLLHDKRFSICHIDVDVYRSGLDILEWVWPRLSTGGIVVFNDYGFPITRGITRLVNEQAGIPGRLVLHNLNGNGILIKTTQS